MTRPETLRYLAPARWSPLGRVYPSSTCTLATLGGWRTFNLVFFRGLILLLCACLAACSRKHAPADAVPPPTRNEIWAAIQPRAERYHIEPRFVYALIAAESGFSPTARNGEARGLFQLKPGAWHQIADTPYEPTVWDWRANLDAGIDYLAYLRSALLRKGHFTQSLWVISYHYGLEAVETRGFDPSAFPPPGGPIFETLWRGETAPVSPP